MVRFLRLRFYGAIFRAFIFSQRQSNHATSPDCRRVRDRLFDATDRRIRFWLPRRQVRPQKFNDDFGVDDLRRLTRPPPVAYIPDDWGGGTGSAASRANGAGSFGRRPIWH